MRSGKKIKKGFTLIEIIVSMALIGIIAVSFLNLFTAGYTTIFSMGRKSQAMNYDAQMYMDIVYDRLDNGDVISDIETDLDGIEGVAVTVENYDDGTGMSLVTITVDYPQNRSVKLSSLVKSP